MAITTLDADMRLQELSDEEFDEIVNQDVRGILDEETSVQLREPLNLERWHDMLLTLKRRVEVQLAANRGEQAAKQAEYLSLGSQGKVLWLRYKSQNERWRQGAIRFKNGVEDKLSEAKRTRSVSRSENFPSILIRERDGAIQQVMTLRNAIIQHRIATVNEEGDQEELDSHLWDLADNEDN